MNNTIYRDSAIQRFEYTLELFWKFLKIYSQENFGVKISSPKGSIREAVSQNILTPEEGETTLKMLDYRNHTSHDYAQSIAVEIAPLLLGYYELMQKTTTELESNA